MPSRLVRHLPFLAAVAAFVSFVPALENLFVNWDDFANFVENPDFRGFDAAGLKWMFTTFHLAHYQPVTWLTWALDRAVWGVNPFGYHLTNLLLHAANAALFCVLCRRLLDLHAPQRPGPGEPESPDLGPLAAFLAALLFAVHPLRAEAVAWATERRELLSALFYLLTLLLYLRRQSSRRLWLLAGLAMLTNVRTVSLPAALLILDYHPLRRLRGREAWLEKLPFAVLALCAGLVGLTAQATTSTLIPVERAGFAGRVAQSFFGIAFYPLKTLFPFGLSNWYGDSYLEARVWVSVLGAALLLFLTAWLAKGRGRRPALWAAWLWYLATLFPSLGIIKSGLQVVADRYSYLPMLPAALLAGGGLAALWRSSRAPGARRRAAQACLVAAAACLPLLAALSWRQCRIWGDSLALWSNAYRVDNRSVFVRVNLGMALLHAKRFDKALAAFETITPENVQGIEKDRAAAFYGLVKLLAAMTHTNWGVELTAADRPGEAVVHFEKALLYNPDFDSAHHNLGMALFRDGRYDEAIAHLEQALAKNPGLAQARFNLGAALAARGRYAEAAARYEEYLAEVPGDEAALKALAAAKAAQRRRR